MLYGRTGGHYRCRWRGLRKVRRHLRSWKWAAFDRLDHIQAVATEEFIREQAFDTFCNLIKEEMDAGKKKFYDRGRRILRYSMPYRGRVCTSVDITIVKWPRFRAKPIHQIGKTSRRPKTVQNAEQIILLAYDGPKLFRSIQELPRIGTRERVKLRSNTKEMKLITPAGPLEFVAIDILGDLITTKRENRYILVITDRYSKLVPAVPLKSISATHIA